MKTHFRLLTGLILLAVLTLVAWTRFAPAETSAAGYTGLARIDGPVELEMAITPPVGSPRDALTLELTLINRTSAEADPIVLINLPPELHATVSRLPAGASFNVQANALTWQPRIAAQTQLQLTLPLRAETADLTDPEVVVTTSLAHDGRNQQAAATLWIGTLPSITRLPSAPRVSIGQPVQLSAEVDGPGPISQTWHLGDGRRVEVNNPQVVYPQAGVYDVVVEATNPLGTVERRMQLTIVPHAAAQFAPDDDTPGVGQTITFRNQSGGQPGMAYSWDFGDGTISAEANPLHTFDTPGTYQVRLIASNAFGTSETIETITVGSPPSADLFVADSAPAGDFVEAVVAADETATEFEWEMGDGRVYEGAEIAHAYRQTGDYYVTMTAKNEFGETRVGKWVHIEPGTLRVFMPIVGNMMGVTEGSSVDIGNGPIELELDPVDLDGEFRMATLDLPAETPLTEALFHYINAAREQFGLNPLQNVGALNNVAQNHANDMAGYDFTSHTGSDGSTPQERFLFYGYRQGYAGEATAWGFDDPKGAVEFWVNSESHRPIILNKYATDVGVGFGREFGSSSIWYWTAEFGNKFASSIQPMLRVEGPAVGNASLNSEVVTFTWNYSGPLAAGQRFTVYLTDESGAMALGSVTAPVHGTRYALSLTPVELGPDSAVGRFEWHVQLEDMVGNAQLVGPSRAITINRDPSLPTPTPMLTPTVPATVTTTPLPTPTPTSTPRSEPPTPTPRPTSPPAVIVTSTPAP